MSTEQRERGGEQITFDYWWAAHIARGPIRNVDVVRRVAEAAWDYASEQASSRLVEVSAELEALQRAWASLTTEGHTKVKRWDGSWHEYPELTSMNVLQVVRTIAAENATLRAEVERLTTENARLAANCDLKDDQIKFQDKALAGLKGERDALEERLSEARIAYGKLFTENAALTGQLEEHEAE